MIRVIFYSIVLLICNFAHAIRNFYKSEGTPFIETARAYENGIGVPKDEEKAFDYYFMAAVEWDKSNPEALAYLKKRAEEGNKYAQFYYGCFWDYEEMRSYDPQKSFYWCQKSAEQNFPLAIMALGGSYCSGIGVEKDIKKGRGYFLKAAEMGDARGYRNLASTYIYGDFAKRDYQKAIEYWMKASELGDPDSDYMLGVCHIYGIEVPVDAKKAFEYFLKSAKAACMPAKICVGICYAYGAGTKRNETEALKWLTEYYGKNTEDAERRLGYSEGCKNLEELRIYPSFYGTYLIHKKAIKEAAKSEK